MDDNVARAVLDFTLKGQRPEGFEIDWTSNLKTPDSVGEKIASFATSGGGWLIVGLSNEKPPKIVGIDDRQVLITRIGEILRCCDPIPTVGEPAFIDIENRTVAVFRITGLGGSVCMYKDTPYQRVQDSSKRMTQNQLREVWIRSGLLTWEQRPSPAGLDAIDRAELEYFLEPAKSRHPVDTKNEFAFLRTTKAITDDGKQLTNLGLISLGQDPSKYLPQCKIQLVRFRGDKPLDRIASILLSFPARKLIQSCENFLLLNLPTKERHEGTKRIEDPIIPPLALREAVVNMIVHRDYSDPQECLIRIFDDRVEFQNPGAPTPMELNKILEQGIPSHRNQWIYNFLRPVHKAEAAGQGIPIMKREMKSRGLNEPEITTLYNIFHLTLRFQERKPETLEDVILLYGRERRKVTTTDVMRIYKISRPTAIKILNSLVRSGYAQHLGLKRTSRYIFKP